MSNNDSSKSNRFVVECESPEEQARLEFARDYLRANPALRNLPAEEQAAAIGQAYRGRE